MNIGHRQRVAPDIEKCLLIGAGAKNPPPSDCPLLETTIYSCFSSAIGNAAGDAETHDLVAIVLSVSSRVPVCKNPQGLDLSQFGRRQRMIAIVAIRLLYKKPMWLIANSALQGDVIFAVGVEDSGAPSAKGLRSSPR